MCCTAIQRSILTLIFYILIVFIYQVVLQAVGSNAIREDLTHEMHRRRLSTTAEDDGVRVAHARSLLDHVCR